MGGKGSNTTTTSGTGITSSTPNPAAMAAYQDLITRTQGLLNPDRQLTAYNGGTNYEQNLGIGNINQYAGAAQPAIQQALQYAQQSGQPISWGDIQQYENPYTQDVINATQAQFAHDNAVQQQGVLGNAAAQGALGGDRVAVAQALTSEAQQRAQAPIIAQLRSQGYSQAVATALAEQAARAQAGISMGGLGVAGQNAGLSGAGAQLGAGGLQQQNLQAYLNAPFQQLGWGAGIETGVGSQMGGTSTTSQYGQKTAPPPNPLSTIAGLGLTAAGAYFGIPGLRSAVGGLFSPGDSSTAQLTERGGRVPGYAIGGATEGSPFGSATFPAIQIARGPGVPRPPSVDIPEGGTENTGNTNLLKGIQALSSGLASARRSSVASPAQSIADLGEHFRGGGVQGFQDGGMPLASQSLNDLLAPVSGLRANASDELAQALRLRAQQQQQPVGFAPTPRVPGDNNPNNPRNWSSWTADNGASGTFAPMDPNYVPLTPREAELGEEAGDVPASMRRRNPLAGIDPSGDPEAIQYADEEGGGAGADEEGGAGIGGGGRFSSLGQGLMAAGLGMLASKSPHFGVGIGEGGLAGLGAYTKAEQQRIANAQKDLSLSQATRRLDQQWKDTQRRLKLQEDQLRRQEEADKNAEAYRRDVLAENKRRSDLQFNAGKVPPGYRIKDDGTMEYIPKGPHDPEQIAAEAKARGEGKVKTLPSALQKDLGEKGASLATLESLSAGFKPEYAGSILSSVGNLQNWIARQTGVGNTDAADWWSQYAAYRNVVRNKLFGSALTQHEASEWEKQDINPGMNPKVLTKNLDRQFKLVESGLRRRAGSLAAQGYPKEAIEAELGHSFGDLGVGEKGAPAPTETSKTPPNEYPDAKLAPDGNFYIPDPARPGKYLKVQ